MPQYAKYPQNGGGVGGIIIGGSVTGGTTGSVLFVGAGSTLAQDPTDFSYNSTTNALTITGAFSASNFSGSSSGTNTGDVTIGTANGLSRVGQVLSLALSSGSTTGALSSTDWTTFNNSATNSANKFLSNLTSPVAVNQDLLPGSDNTRSFGSSSFTWAAGWFSGGVRLPTAVFRDSVLTNKITINSDLVTTPSGGLLPAMYQPQGPASLAATRDIAFFTESGSSANPSGTIHIETGNNAGAGASGDLTFRTGTSGGTRGTLIFQNGSEGTAGYVWTSTDTTGKGSWAVNAGGTAITALTSDVTATGPGSAIATIANNVVTNAKLAQMPTLTIKGNNTGGTANALDLTVAQVNLILPVFTSVLNGLVPLSGGGTTNFLRADGTWAPAGTGTVTAVTASAPLSSTGGTTPNISISQSNTTTDGYLSSTDWNTFNNKQAAGNYITALTGDATATGPGSVALTLATVNGNVGTFGTATQVGTFTVNSKGLITAASNTTIALPFSQVSGVVPANQGGTGVANNAASTLTISGNFGTTLTVGATTSLTLPASGTIATLAGTETFTNKTFGNAITNTQISTPSNPAAGFDKLYFKSDNILYSLSSGGIETAYVTSITTYAWSGYHDSTNGNSWSRSSSSFGDFTNADSSITLTEVSNSNFGSVTGYGASSGSSALPGLVFSPPVTGFYNIKASFVVNTNTATNQFVGTRLMDSTGSTIIDASGVTFATTQVVNTITLEGIIQYTTTSSKTISIEGANSASGTFFLDNIIRAGVSGGHSIEWSISKIN